MVGAEEMGRVGRREAVETVRVKGAAETGRVKEAEMGRWREAAGMGRVKGAEKQAAKRE